MDERAVERREVRWIVHGEAKQLTSAAVEGGAVTPLRAEPSWAPLVLPELVSADFKILLSDPHSHRFQERLTPLLLVLILNWSMDSIKLGGFSASSALPSRG
jgi:hypothetical protein